MSVHACSGHRVCLSITSTAGPFVKIIVVGVSDGEVVDVCSCACVCLLQLSYVCSCAINE